MENNGYDYDYITDEYGRYEDWEEPEVREYEEDYGITNRDFI